MRNERNPYKLSDVVQFNPAERLSKGAIAKKVAMEHLQPFTRAISGYELAVYSGGSKFRNGDTLMARITPCLENGKTAYVSFLDNGEVGFGSTEYIVFRSIEGVTDSKFVYYFVTSPWFRNIAIKSMVGSSGRQRVQQSVLENLEVNIPPLEEQKRIAAILGSLDDKIELNRRINANLEEQAQALFKSWFVDFEPFRDSPFVDSELGKIPQGWKVCRLKNATKEIIRGFTSKYVEKSDLINLNQKVNKGKYLDRQYYKYLNPQISIPSNKFACQNDILLNSLGQGTLGRVHYYGELTPNIVIDQHITIIRANNTTFQSSFIYLFLSSNEIQHSIEGMVTGSTGMQMLNISQVREMSVLQPDVDTMNKFHRIVQPFFTKIRKNNTEIEIIANIRGILLPKLMSGEISVEKGFTD